MRARAAPGPRLTIAISTLGDRAGQIALPDPHADIAYLILWQRPGDVAPPGRADVTVARLDSQGVAASRNAALAQAETPYLLFGDDDVALDLAGVTALLAALETDPRLAIATGRLTGTTKRHPPRAHPLRLWNCAKTGTPEILLRLDPVRAKGLRFDPDFGLGARHPLGDEYVFLADALRAGLTGRYLPVTIGHHPAVSTGGDWTDPALLRARVAVLGRVFGALAPLVRLGFALKHRRRLAAVRGAFWGFVTGRL